MLPRSRSRSSAARSSSRPWPPRPRCSCSYCSCAGAGSRVFAGARSVAAGLAAVALLPRLELVPLSTAANGVVDAAGVGTLQWSDANLLFGSFGTHAGELAPLYAGALTPALVVVALITGAAARRASRLRWPARDPLVGRARRRPRAPVRPAALHHGPPGGARAALPRAGDRSARRAGVRQTGLATLALARGGARRRDRAGRPAEIVLLHRIYWCPPSPCWPCSSSCARGAGRRPSWPARWCRACSRPISPGTTTRSRIRISLPPTGTPPRGLPEPACDRSLPAGAPGGGGADALRLARQRLHAQEAAALLARPRLHRLPARQRGHALRPRGRRRLRPLQLLPYRDAIAASNDRRRRIATSSGSIGRPRDCCAASACAITSPGPSTPRPGCRSCCARRTRRSCATTRRCRSRASTALGARTRRASSCASPTAS